MVLDPPPCVLFVGLFGFPALYTNTTVDNIFTDVNTNTCIYVIRRVVDLQSFRTLYIKTTVDGMLAEMATIVYVIHWLI